MMETGGTFQFQRPKLQAKWAWAYIGHAVQGFLSCLVIPLPALGCVLAWYYMKYQETEYRRARDYFDTVTSGRQVLDEWISRDIMHWMVGGWLAFFIQLAVLAYFGLRYLGIL